MPTAPTKPPPPSSRPKPPPPSGGAPTSTAVKAEVPKIGKIEAAFEPPRLILNAVEGFGKTTMAAYSEKPLIVMAGGETGYKTLLGSGRVPNVDCARTTTWAETLALIDHVIDTNTGHETFAMDAMGGFERQCHQHVCDRDFNGNWGEKGFGSFQKGYDLSVNDWLQMLVRLDRLREKRGMTILLLSHSKAKTFKNPMGADFDRYIADVHEKTWAVTAKWSDAVFFGTFFSVVEGGQTGEKARKGKGIGGTDRVVYCDRRDAFDAKNRYGMPECIDMPSEPDQAWSTLWSFITNNGEQQ